MTVNKSPQFSLSDPTCPNQRYPKARGSPHLFFWGCEDLEKHNGDFSGTASKFTIVKDLVVDMAPFWNQYRKIKPYFDREWKDTIPESSQNPMMHN